MIENNIPWLILETPQKQRHHRWIQVRLSIKMQQSNMAKSLAYNQSQLEKIMYDLFATQLRGILRMFRVTYRIPT